MPDPDIAVVHLVRRGNPARYLRQFMRSYRTHAAGCAHDLVVLLKGYDTVEQVAWPRLGGFGVSPRVLPVSDSGFDINAYRHAASLLANEYVCFLNSHSIIEADDWLARLHGAFARHADTGACGASGSWERLDDSQPFPNVHLRTNAFLIRRELFLELDFGPLATKRDCNLFEAGPAGMTRQLAQRGLVARVAGRDGAVTGPQDWAANRTFRSGNQEQLLVSDNRTRKYQVSLARRRRKLAGLSFGPQATIVGKQPGDWLRQIALLLR